MDGGKLHPQMLRISSLLWPTNKFRRRQLQCFFIIFIAVTLISSLFYTLQKTKSYKTLKLEILYRALHFGLSKPSEDCTFLVNDSSKGPIEVDTTSILSFEDLEYKLGHNLRPGGHFVPVTCRSKHKVAIIVAYRDREIHLKLFLHHMHPFLQRQNLEYGIIVVEQAAGTPFNRAILMNIGFVESLKILKYDCFVFHDVDLLPLDDRNFYSCGDEPVHLSAAIDSHDNKLMYQNIFGGASMMTKEMMNKVNGFSNAYFGWGGEDDDMSYRVRSHGMVIVRYDSEVARYTMMRHAKEDQEDRTNLFRSSKNRIHEDGLNALKYQLLGLKLEPLYTWVYVKIDPIEILKNPSLYVE